MDMYYTDRTLNKYTNYNVSSNIFIGRKTYRNKLKNLLSLCFDDPRLPTSIVDEFAAWMYSNLTLDDEENDNVLEFWSHHSKSFLVISTILYDIFAIPALNTMIERLFSICKNSITDK